MGDQYRVRVWKGRNPDGEDYQGDPDEIVTVSAETPFVWQEDPHYHSPSIGIDLHPEDALLHSTSTRAILFGHRRGMILMLRRGIGTAQWNRDSRIPRIMSTRRSGVRCGAE